MCSDHKLEINNQGLPRLQWVNMFILTIYDKKTSMQWMYAVVLWSSYSAAFIRSGLQRSG